ncbi:MAG: alpha/beta hydrolase [Proteobacteria bacterium]|nr:alpha/beta hydrolase [Pseudomonadota bacterium]
MATQYLHLFDTYLEAQAHQALSGLAPGDPLVQPIDEARRKQALYFQSLNAHPTAVHNSQDFLVEGACGSIPIRLVHGSSDAPAACIIFLRGAGFWSGSIDSHLCTIHSLANLTRAVVCAVDYRRTPEYCYPVQQQEVLCVIRWLIARGTVVGVGPARYVLFGESAGATLALSVSQTLRDANDLLPTGLVLFYPNAGGPKAGSRPYSQWVWRSYLGEADHQTVLSAIPVRRNMRGLPPIWIGCGTEDLLLHDSEELAQHLAQADVPHSVNRFPGLPHAFLMHAARLRPAQQALEQAAIAAASFLEAKSET